MKQENFYQTNCSDDKNVVTNKEWSINKKMNINDFDFDLPEELIAQTPLEKRSESRLLVLDPKDHGLQDKHFYDIID